MATRTQIQGLVYDVIFATGLWSPKNTIRDEHRFKEEYGMTQADKDAWLVHLNNKIAPLGVLVSLAEIRACKRVGDLVNLILAKLGGAAKKAAKKAAKTVAKKAAKKKPAAAKKSAARRSAGGKRASSRKRGDK